MRHSALSPSGFLSDGKDLLGAEENVFRWEKDLLHLE
jgi:hypothetical protein